MRGADPAHSPEDKVTFLHLWSLRSHSVHWPARPDQLERGDATSTATATPRPRWAPARPSRPLGGPSGQPRGAGSRGPAARRDGLRLGAVTGTRPLRPLLPASNTRLPHRRQRRTSRPKGKCDPSHTRVERPSEDQRDDAAVSDPAQATARDAAFTSPQLSGLHETSRAGTHSDNIRRTQHIKSCFAYHPDVSTAQNPWTATVLGQACPGGA